MAGSQVLTISYGGMQVEGQVIDGKLQISLPAASLIGSDGKAKSLDPALLQFILQLVLQLLPQFLDILRGGGP